MTNVMVVQNVRVQRSRQRAGPRKARTNDPWHGALPRVNAQVPIGVMEKLRRIIRVICSARGEFTELAFGKGVGLVRLSV